MTPGLERGTRRIVSQIHLIGGEKGGVGKSVISRLLAQYFIDREQSFAAVDADTSHPALCRYYSEYAEAIDLTNVESADKIIEHCLEDDRKVLVDLPAQSARLLKEWIDNAGVLEFARDHRISVTMWHVTDGGFDSLQELAALLSRYNDKVGYVVVRNEGRSRSFAQFDDSEVRDRVLALSGRIVSIPELHPATMYKIDRQGSSYWASINDSTSQVALPPMDRQRTRLWLKQCHSVFDALHLIPRDPS